MAALDDPHARLDKERGSDEATGVEEQEQEPQSEKPHERARAVAALRFAVCVDVQLSRMDAIQAGAGKRGRLALAVKT